MTVAAGAAETSITRAGASRRTTPTSAAAAAAVEMGHREETKGTAVAATAQWPQVAGGSAADTRAEIASAVMVAGVGVGALRT